MAEFRSARPPMCNLREPFERLVDNGLRLNELRTERVRHDFLIDKERANARVGSPMLRW